MAFESERRNRLLRELRVVGVESVSGDRIFEHI
jgi:hypothetical protein